MSVVVGYRDDARGRAALARGIEEALLRSLPLHVLASVRVQDPGGAGPARGQADRLNAIEAELDDIARRARESGVADVETHLVLESRGEGQFLGDMRNLVQAVDAELVVIGLRNRSRVGKFVLGSRAQDVLLNIDCAVLAVRAPADEA